MNIIRDTKGRFIKGFPVWKKGESVDRKKFPNRGHFKKHSPESRLKISIANKGKHYSPETEFKEKDGELGYVGLHSWIYRNYGKAKKCIYGHKSKKYVWANISGEYKRDISDWHQLCHRCNLTDGIKINQRFKKI